MTKLMNRLADIKKRRAAGDKGFSLVELAVVIVVIGILVAIAIPVFNGIQAGAKESTIKAAAANASSMIASEIATGGDITDAAFTASLDKLLPEGTITVTGTTLTDYCVTASDGATQSPVTAKKGPGCTP